MTAALIQRIVIAGLAAAGLLASLGACGSSLSANQGGPSGLASSIAATAAPSKTAAVLAPAQKAGAAKAATSARAIAVKAAAKAAFAGTATGAMSNWLNGSGPNDAGHVCTDVTNLLSDADAAAVKTDANKLYADANAAQILPPPDPTDGFGTTWTATMIAYGNAGFAIMQGYSVHAELKVPDADVKASPFMMDALTYTNSTCQI